MVDYLYGNMGDFPSYSEETGYSWGVVGEDMFFSLVTWGYGCSWYKPAFDAEYYKGKSPYPPVGWKGPYLDSLASDPWGFKYIVSINGIEPMGKNPSNSGWCLSAGPNNIVDTAAWETEIRGDDIGYRAE